MVRVQDQSFVKAFNTGRELLERAHAVPEVIKGAVTTRVEFNDLAQQFHRRV